MSQKCHRRGALTGRADAVAGKPHETKQQSVTAQQRGAVWPPIRAWNTEAANKGGNPNVNRLSPWRPARVPAWSPKPCCTPKVARVYWWWPMAAALAAWDQLCCRGGLVSQNHLGAKTVLGTGRAAGARRWHGNGTAPSWWLGARVKPCYSGSEGWKSGTGVAGRLSRACCLRVASSSS